jgi:hydroxypyruvate reductase
VNLLRKQLDRIKGGGLLRRAGRATVLALVLSDVIGDDLAVIASAPTLPGQQRDFLRALELLDRYDLRPSRAERDRRGPADERPNAFPLRAYEFLLQGAKTQVRQVQSAAAAAAGPPLLEFDSSHPGAPAAAPTADAAAASSAASSNVTNVLVGSNRHSLDAAARRARELGYDAHVLTDRLDGEAAVAAEWLARAAIPVGAAPRSVAPTPRAWIAGGETTVTFAPSALPAQSAQQPGLGGRSQEFALAAAAHLYRHEVAESGRGECRTVLLAGGSDGTDGPTDATGAVVDARTWSRAQQAGLDGAQYLRRHDSYNFFSKLDSSTQQQQQQQQPLTHLKPGPTGTNVGDIYLALSR